MSTPKENKSFPTENVLCGIRFIVHKEGLGDFIKRIRESKNLSLEDVRAKSKGQLATSYVNRIENNQVSADVISIGKLGALAKGLEEPVSSLIDIAIGQNHARRGSEGELANIVSELPPHRVDDLLAIAKIYYKERTQAQDERIVPKGFAVAPRSASRGIPLINTDRVKIKRAK